MIFRVPVDNQHFKDTIENGKPVSEVAGFLSGEEKARVQRISRDGVVKYWGSIPGEGNKRNFEKLTEGDELLCYRSGKYIALAKVAFKTTNRDLAKYSWGETEVGSTWELVYFFSEVRLIEVDSEIINKEFDYSDGPVQGFSALSDDKFNEFVKKHLSVENLLRSLGYEQKIQEKISEEISKLQIKSPYEAQFYLVDLGNQLEFDTYVPPNDAGREVFGKKLLELTTIQKEDLSQYVAPAIFDPLSNIDVIWFKEHYRPQFFYEVVHSSGMTEAFARLKTVADYYETAKTRIIGEEENKSDFEKSRRLHFPDSPRISYKFYKDLINLHSETLHFKKVTDNFLQ